MIPQWVIEKKRDGHSLTDAEIRAFIVDYTAGAIPDYQMSALAMAIFFRGLDAREVTTLTDAMMRSGEQIDSSGLDMPTSDKHSTGGIGDKVSLLLAPMVACCGVGVPMLSGRGLGITGGTLDKLEAIRGYRTNLETAEFLDVIRACGCCIMGQTGTLAPADRKLYALRDVTGTVPSIPLIAASIMSKKLAEGTATLVLDVKCGNGAFMQRMEDARALAEVMIRIGRGMGRDISALITAMDQPLGTTVGNALEVVETVEALQGKGAPDLMEVTLRCGIEMLRLTQVELDADAARNALVKTISTGMAFERLKQMVALQGGDPAVLDDTGLLPQAPVVVEVPAPEAGYIAGVEAKGIGRAVLQLGAGRKQTTDTIDPSVGVSHLVKVGGAVSRGDALARIYAASETDAAMARDQVLAAIQIAGERVVVPPVILDVVGAEGAATKHG
ncbi:MAG: thymidine phosphorylase [Kiritimatiellia bacterium]